MRPSTTDRPGTPIEVVVYRRARTLDVESRLAEPPGRDDVTVEVAYTGICGTDLHIYHGDMDARVGPAAVLGHEMSGRIAAVGEDVTGWSVGQAVTVMPTRSCGRCAACQRGNTHVCHAMNFLGIDSPGAMQSRWNVPADLVFTLPDSLPLDHAALAEPVAVAVHDVRRAGVGPGDFVVVVGGGPVGILIALVSRHRGCRVLLVEPDPFRRSLAQAIGFEAIEPEAGVVALVNERTVGAGADAAFEVSGSAGGVTTAAGVLTSRGRLVMVAIHPRPRPVDLHRFFWRELEMLGARLYQRNDVAEAIQLLAAGAIPAALLISRTVPAHDADAAFAAVEEGSGIMKVLLDWQGRAR